MRFYVDTKIPKAGNNWLKTHKDMVYMTNQFNMANGNITQVPSVPNYKRHDLHDINTISSSDDSVVFRTYKYLPKKIKIGFRIIDFYSPQGINVTGGGQDAYISYNSSSSNSNKFGKNMVEMLRVNLKQPGKIVGTDSSELSVGEPFKGGHGQAITRNPKDGSIWNMASKVGNTNKGYMQRIKRSDMLPFYQMSFNIKKYGAIFGDDIVFDKSNHIYNFEKPAGENYINIYKGKLSWQVGFHMDLQKQRIPAPYDILQDAAYNPNDGRIYLISDNQITAIPSNRIGKLKSSDFQQWTFDSDIEPEGLSFTNNGRAFMLTSRSPEIYSTNSFM